GDCQPAALLAVLRCENLEAAAQLEARLEHVQVVVVVFDVEHFGHVTDSVLLTAALITSSLNHLVGAGAWLSTYPAATASATTANTIGTARVTCRKLATAMLVNAMTTSGASATSSTACLRIRSASPAPQRMSTRMLRPSDQPNCCSSCRNAA